MTIVIEHYDTWADAETTGVSTMLVEIDPRAGKPAYLQIVDQIKYAAAAGRLRAGEPLPSIRQLAERLRLNRNTVDKAYRELDHQGVIETVRGRGAFVSERESPFDEGFRHAVLTEAVDGLIVKAHHFRLPDEELLDLVRQRLAAFAERRLETAQQPESEEDHAAAD